MREWLKNLRTKQKLKQSEIAEVLGISQTNYNLIEMGKRQKDLDLSLALKLAKVFGVSIDFIIAEEEKIKKKVG